jgi:hypothetical protein
VDPVPDPLLTAKKIIRKPARNRNKVHVSIFKQALAKEMARTVTSLAQLTHYRR